MRLLGLAYDRDIPRAVLAEMEHAARQLGLPLATVEALGRDGALCRAFVSAARRADAERMRLFAQMARPDPAFQRGSARAAPRGRGAAA